MNFLAEIEKTVWNGNTTNELLKSIDVEPLFNYETHGLIIHISRDEKDANVGLDFSVFVNVVRCYINAHVEVNVLHFDLNHEQKHGAPANVIVDTHDPIYLDNIREALNSVRCRQIRSRVYELKIENPTPNPAKILTSSIRRKDNGPNDDFPTTCNLGELPAFASLHIKHIYMKSGKMFSDQIREFANGSIVIPDDRTCYSFAGFCGRLPDPTGTPVGTAKKISLRIQQQRWVDPMVILTSALAQLAADLDNLDKIISSVKDSVYDTPELSITIRNNQLLCRISCIEPSLAQLIASTAKVIDPMLTHYTAKQSGMTSYNSKEAVVRLASPDSDLLSTLASSVRLCKKRTVSLVK